MMTAAGVKETSSPRRQLPPRHRLIVRALAEALFSEDGELDGARLDAFVGEVDRYIRPVSRTLRFGLLLMLDVLRWSTLLFGRLAPFDALAPHQRVRHLERLECSRIAPLAQVVVAYKILLTILFYEDAEQQRALGYPGPERRRWRLALAPTAARSEAP